MYHEPYHLRQQAAYHQDTSWLSGNFDFFTKIMGFSFFASLFGGIPGGGDGIGGVGAGQGSYVWNTIILFLLGLLVETGRRFCQWIIQRIRFRLCLELYQLVYLTLLRQNIRLQRNSLKGMQRMSGLSSFWYLTALSIKSTDYEPC